MDFVSFARLTFLNFWPVDDKAPFWGPSSTIITSQEAADAVPEQKEAGAVAPNLRKVSTKKKE